MEPSFWSRQIKLPLSSDKNNLPKPATTPALIVESSSDSQIISPDWISIFDTLPFWSAKNNLLPEKAGSKLLSLFSPLNFISQFSINSNLSLPVFERFSKADTFVLKNKSFFW